MKHKHAKHTGRWKVTGMSAAFFAVGIGLIVLSNVILESGGSAITSEDGSTASAPAASAPAGPATAPANTGSGPVDPLAQRKAAAQSMSGMLLLVGLMSFGFGAICAGWVAYDVYRSRPAWKTQTKYPRRR